MIFNKVKILFLLGPQISLYFGNDYGDSFVWSLDQDDCIAYFTHQMLMFRAVGWMYPWTKFAKTVIFVLFQVYLGFSMNVLRFFLFHFCYM